MARILVVDDEADIRQVIRIALESDGHDVVEADDGLTAFETARDGGIDLVLLDVVMPGMDGYQLLEKLLNLPGFNAPVVMVTGRSDAEAMYREAEAGAIDHISKPFTGEELARTVRRLLALSQEEIAARRRILARSALVHAAVAGLRDLFVDDPKPQSRRLFRRGR